MEAEDVDTATVGTTSGPDDPDDPGALAAPPVPPVRRSPSMRPALLVVGIAAGLVLIFGILSLVSSPGSNTTSVPSKPAKVKGTPLLAVSAEKTLKPIEEPGTPPDNIIDALTLPQGAVALSHQDNTTSSTQYDEQMQFSMDASENALIAFYKAELKTKGWGIINVGSATNLPGGIEVLAQKGGDDGWYWEVGAVVSPTTFSSANSSGTESTKFTLRLFEEPDDD